MKFLYLILLFSLPVLVWAQEVQPQEKSFWATREAELTSPWTTAARPWLIYGSVFTLGVLAIEDKIEDPLQAETVEDKPLGKFSALGDAGGQGLTNLIYVLSMGGSYLLTKSDKAYENMSAMLIATTYAVGASTALKGLVHEPRPNDPSTLNSFPSGHTTTAFVFSSTIVAQHGLWPWGFAASALASLTAYSRINDNKHNLHDVVAGFTIGSAYGFGISYLHQGKLLAKNDSASSALNIWPVYSEEIKGLVAQYDF